MSAEYVQFKSDTIQCVVHDPGHIPFAITSFVVSRVWQCERAYTPSVGAGSEPAPTKPVHPYRTGDPHGSRAGVG